MLTGLVTGGRQPIVGSAVTVYEGGTVSGGAATVIGTATTDSHGNFNVASFNPVPTNGDLIYVVVQGGDAGGGDNSAVRLMSVVGPYCSGAGCTFPARINIDEFSTVASVYSMAGYTGFGGGAVNLSGPSPGLGNAAATVANLVDIVSGQAAASLNLASCTGTGSLPPNCATLKKLNTLASVIASCINSSGPGSTACGGLAAHTGGATDTLGALYNIATTSTARNDGSGIFGLVSIPQVYTPGVSAAPNDWTLALNFSGGGLSAPSGVAIDAAGNVWVADNQQVGALSKLSPTGAALSPSTGYTGNGLAGSLGVAIDPSGHVWVADWFGGGGTRVSKFNADGSAATGSPFKTGISGAIDFAINPAGEVWVVNYGNGTVTKLSAAGAVLTGPLSGNGLNFPTGIALDSAGNVWVANTSGDSFSEFSATGVPIGVYANAGLKQPYALAIDDNGNVWSPSQSIASVVEVFGGNTPPTSCPVAPVAGDTGCSISPIAANGKTGGYTGGGLAGPLGIAIDGAGHVFVSNYKGASISELSPAGVALSPAPLSPSTAPSGYTGPGLAQPYGIAIDASGNVWVANSGNNSVTEFIGLATPVVTPKIGQPLLP
ncbi:MAG: repeat containing protein [Nevskia sp.]|nr:repeat containing protein [Nevskia sp.]